MSRLGRLAALLSALAALRPASGQPDAAASFCSRTAPCDGLRAEPETHCCNASTSAAPPAPDDPTRPETEPARRPPDRRGPSPRRVPAGVEIFCLVADRALGACVAVGRCARREPSVGFCRPGAETCCRPAHVLAAPAPTPPRRHAAIRRPSRPGPARQLTADCGRLPAARPGSKIAGGRAAAALHWPWMARLGLRDGRRTRWFCGGALLSARYVLTAAHCVPPWRPARRLVVRLGPGGTGGRGVAAVLRHPDHRPGTKHADLALLRLARPAAGSGPLAAVCLPGPGDRFLGRRAAVAGWGRQGWGGRVPDRLVETTVHVTDTAECEAAYRRLSDFEDAFPGGFGGTKLCAADAGRDACAGDSGGPLVVVRPDGRRVIIGVVSSGYRCAEHGFPGIYTRVAPYVEWIVETAA